MRVSRSIPMLTGSLVAIFFILAGAGQARAEGCGQVTLDKQVSCDGVNWVDVGDVVANEDGTHGCLGFNAHPGTPAGALKVMYVAKNSGSTTLYDCVVTESNASVCGTMDAGDLAPGATWSFLDEDQSCSETLDDHEPDTATVSCFCNPEHVPEDLKATASDSADFDCQTPGLAVSKICKPLEGGGGDVDISIRNTGMIQSFKCKTGCHGAISNNCNHFSFIFSFIFCCHCHSQCS